MPDFTHETYIEQNISNRQKQWEKIAQKAGCEKMGIKTHTLVSTGVPYLELLHAIESQKPDLLVMGTKGRSNLVDTIAGSCAQKMFRRSPIPLLSIRGKEQS
jgi:nucleotide-binding universal stress UspA family protein